MIKDHYNMDFNPSKIPAEILMEGSFETCFKNIYSNVTNKWYNDSWKQSSGIKDGFDPKFFNSTFYDMSINKYGVACDTSLRLWEDNGQIGSIAPYGWRQQCFRYSLGRRSLDGERQIKRWKGIVGRFKGRLVGMFGKVNGRFDDY